MYAQIINDKVNLIEVNAEDVQALVDNGLTIVDITEVDPIPKTGWNYDAETGEFTEPEIVVSNNLYIHLSMTDGDGREPLGIKNDGVDAVGIVATFRQSDSPESPIVTAINMAWRVTIRNEAGLIYDIVDITFVNGVASINYTTTGTPDICGILESDFEPYDLGGTVYKFRLIGNSTFKVYRQL